MTYSERMRIAAAEAQGWKGPWRFGNRHLHGTPPNAEDPAIRGGDHVPDRIDKIVRDMAKDIDQMAEGIRAVRNLMGESQGVAGFHQNGDIAEWEELEAGGIYEDWLWPLDDAEKVAARVTDWTWLTLTHGGSNDDT